MNSDATYLNHHHYIREGWSKEPKESFKALAGLIRMHHNGTMNRILDVGCATGELLGYLQSQFSEMSCLGVDVFEDLLEAGRALVPSVEFAKGSALDLTAESIGIFDVVTAMGVMSIFDETEIEKFWASLLAVTHLGGTIIVLAPVNEYSVDTMIRHRKRIDGAKGEWETGWNIFAMDTVEDVLGKLGQSCQFVRFSPDLVLEPQKDPVRTWTLPTAQNQQQLTNGLKLLVDHYFMIVKVV